MIKKNNMERVFALTVCLWVLLMLNNLCFADKLSTAVPNAGQNSSVHDAPESDAAAPKKTQSKALEPAQSVSALDKLVESLHVANTVSNINTASGESFLVTKGNTQDKTSNNLDESSDESSKVDKPSDAIGGILLQAVSLMGIPYRWGGNNPEMGMDCSGFIRYVFKKSMGITLPRTAAEMAKVGKRVSLDEMQPGDLIFFNTRRGSNTHLGMYIGDNKFIQSPRTGERIQVTELSGYWRSHINGAKRIVQENEDDDGNEVVQQFQDIHNEALPTYAARYRHKHHGKKHALHQLRSSTHRKKLATNLARRHRHKIARSAAE